MFKIKVTSSTYLGVCESSCMVTGPSLTKFTCSPSQVTGLLT